MLKIRIIPVLTFNGFSLVKTKQFKNPRTIGNPIQAARIFNNRNVDELIFVDIEASKQNRKINLNVVSKIIEECYMPITIGGGISSFEDINNLLKIGADKVLIKSKAIEDPTFIFEAVNYFGSQCISIAVDVFKQNNSYFIYQNNLESISLESFILKMNTLCVGEFAVNYVNNDGMMNGYELQLYNEIMNMTEKPIIAIGGASEPNHFVELVASGFFGGIAASSIYNFTEYTPNDVKLAINKEKKLARL